MTAALALLLGAFIAGRVGPGLLGRADLTRADPSALLTAWLLSTAGVLAAAVSGIVLLLFPGHGAGTSVLSAVHGCLAAISHGTSPRAEELVGLAGAVLMTALAGRFAVIGIQIARRRARRRREQLGLLRIAARCDDGAPATWWLDYERPLAFSVAHGRGVIVATEGLRSNLPAREVAAVLAHEEAHLRGRHHLVIACVEAMSQAMPFVPLFRCAPAAVRELVELTADAAAVRSHGTEAVRTALLAVSGHGAPDGSLAMARDAVAVRLARLDATASPSGRVRRALSCGVAATAATSLPVLMGAALLFGVAVAACPLSGA